MCDSPSCTLGRCGADQLAHFGRRDYALSNLGAAVAFAPHFHEGQRRMARIWQSQVAAKPRNDFTRSTYWRAVEGDLPAVKTASASLISSTVATGRPVGRPTRNSLVVRSKLRRLWSDCRPSTHDD